MQRKPRRIGAQTGGERFGAAEEKEWIAFGMLGFSRLALGGKAIGGGWLVGFLVAWRVLMMWTVLGA
jgi:hypothetical protein